MCAYHGDGDGVRPESESPASGGDGQVQNDDIRIDNDAEGVEAAKSQSKEVNEVAVAIEEEFPAVSSKALEPSEERSSWLRQLDWRLVFYGVVTCCYFVYRNQAPSMFTPAAFRFSWNDAWGLLFLAAFVVTRRASCLVYAINPVRNLIMVAAQSLVPNWQESRVNPEFYRNIASACIQLSCALLMKLLVKPQPIGAGTAFAERTPCCDEKKPRLQRYSRHLMTALLGITAVGAIALAARKQTDEFADWLSEDHGLKILMSLVLGISEEVTWRDVYMADNNNCLQAFTWGMNHLVAGEGMSNPWLYGAVSGGYAFALGVTEYRAVRFLNHAAVEYFVIDNLVKPEGHPVWDAANLARRLFETLA
eukprot:gb/GFBE01057121.1/.p1 GENE.gb/GFBE01057121.1/~~gb/GFBE01057121.1/.p1  ORF type:complete len:364 (+),score=70.56 gb/GFBE01057121.1/:1-1092(+)